MLEDKYGVSAGEISTAKCPKNLCKVCERTVERARAAGAFKIWKQRLERLCKFAGDQPKVEKCKQLVDVHIDHLDKETPRQVCQELLLC